MAFAAVAVHVEDPAAALFLALRNARCVVAAITGLHAGVSAPAGRLRADLNAAAAALADQIVTRLLHWQRASKTPDSSQLVGSCQVRCSSRLMRRTARVQTSALT